MDDHELRADRTDQRDRAGHVPGQSRPFGQPWSELLAEVARRRARLRSALRNPWSSAYAVLAAEPLDDSHPIVAGLVDQESGRSYLICGACGRWWLDPDQ